MQPSFRGELDSLNCNTEGNLSVIPQEPTELSTAMSAENTSSTLPLQDLPPSLHIEDLPPPKLDFSAPPPYEVASKLPTYEEVQREKTRLGEPQINNVGFYLEILLRRTLFETH